MKIGFAGVGHMGAPMARNLMARGHLLTVFDPAEENAASLAQAGAGVAMSPAELAPDKDVIVTMLPSGQEVRAVYLDEGGVIANASPGALLIDCSTADVNSARKVARVAAKRGIGFIDAPVSGGVAGAEGASLTFMVGGEASAVERARPVLEAMGKKIVHVGEAGAGQAVKICNNLILGTSMIGVCEAFVLAEHLGLAAERLFEVSANSSGQCWSLTSYCPVPGLVAAAPSNRDYQPGFSARMMLKDLRLAVAAAERSDCHLALGEMAARLYERFVQEGAGNMDFSAIIKDLRQR